mgnify:CR=1 FL=1
MPFKGTFEEAVKRLEDIAQMLETGEQPLDESMKLYEEGMELVTFCNKKLGDVEKKVKKLSKKGDDSFQVEEL